MRIIDTSSLRQWNKVLSKIKSADIFYSNSFSRLTSGSKLFVYSGKNNLAVFPFNAQGNIIYGLRYGGILCKKHDRAFLYKATQELCLWCRQQGIKKIIVRVHPFMRVGRLGSIYAKEPFAFIELSKPAQILENKITGRHRDCIKSAIRNKLAFGCSSNKGYLKLFYALYNPMLENKGIVPKSRLYFEKLGLYLKKNIFFAYVKCEKKIIAVSIILKSARNAYMMYGGMNMTGYKKYAKHFMIYKLMLDLRKRGYKRLILGTGECPGDSVYMFKSGFTDKKNYLYTYSKNVC